MFLHLQRREFTKEQTVPRQPQQEKRNAFDEVPGGMAWVSGGEFTMGSDSHYPEEQPSHLVRVDSFFIDTHAVTNRQFADFVAGTGYITIVERIPDPANYPGADPNDLVPGARVFQRTAGPVPLDDYRQWWRFVPGASWRHPEGPGSSIDNRQDHPVVQVSYADAFAYARWADKSLPTEAQGSTRHVVAWTGRSTPGAMSSCRTAG